jgi:uncharacterized protein (UPF0332 family)
MFYTAEALLEAKDLRFSKHGGVHGAFGEHYVKTGIKPQEFHRWLLDVFDVRIEQAKEFLSAAESHLQSQP